MLRKIDIGVDKNLFIVDPKTAGKPPLKFLSDDIPRSAEETINEARRVAWPNWLNSEPLVMGHVEDDGTAYLFSISDALSKKIVLMHVWDFTLLPCRRALSYFREWHKRYGHSGLLIIGIHSPMFEFAKEKKLIQDSLRELGLQYPVCLDNDFAIWKSLENRFWPRMLLLDSNMQIQLDAVGEGRYDEFETNIQLLLRDLSPGLPCPPILKPLRKTDDPEYQIPPTTTEIFLGLKRKMRLGNQQSFKKENEELVFKEESQGAMQTEVPYLIGGWLSGPESIWGTPHRGDIKLNMKFNGTDVYLVARCRPKNPIDPPLGTKIEILVDRKQLSEEKISGTDAVMSEVRRSVVIARDPKLYHIATKLAPGSHELTLTVLEDPLHTVEIYGIFFAHGA